MARSDMNIDNLNDKVKAGVFTEEEKKQILEEMRINEDGEFIGNSMSSTLPKDFQARFYMNGFPETKEELINYIVNFCDPWLGAESCTDPIFKKYGYTFDTVCSTGWQWVGLEEASELELWKIIAICKAYWLGHQEEARCHPIGNNFNTPRSSIHTPVYLGEFNDELKKKMDAGEIKPERGDWFTCEGKKFYVMSTDMDYKEEYKPPIHHKVIVPENPAPVIQNGQIPTIEDYFKNKKPY